MKICVMGLTASGKSYQSKRIASHFHWNYVSAASLLLKRLSFAGNQDEHFWLEDAGRELNRRRDNSTVDREVDEELLRMAPIDNNVVFDSWALPWLYKRQDMLRIYLSASLRARARMAYHSKNQKRYSVEKLMQLIDVKDQGTRDRFLNAYGFDINDVRSFDLVFDNSNSSAQETSRYLIRYVEDIPK